MLLWTACAVLVVCNDSGNVAFMIQVLLHSSTQFETIPELHS